MQTIQDTNFDTTFENLFFVGDGTFNISKKNISVSDDVFRKRLIPLVQQLDGLYVKKHKLEDGSDGGQYYAFKDEQKAKTFAREFFLLATAKEKLHNTRIPFTDLILRKDKASDDLFHVFRQNPEADGNSPILAYFSKNSDSFRTPKLTQVQDIRQNGVWNTKKVASLNGLETKDFSFNTITDFVNFAEDNKNKTVSDTYNNNVVNMRYDNDVNTQIKQAESDNKQNPNPAQSQHSQQDRADSDKPSSDDDRAEANKAIAKDDNTQKENDNSSKQPVQLELFPEIKEPVTVSTTISNAYNHGTGKQQKNSSERQNDEGRNRTPLSGDKNVHDTRADQSNVPDADGGHARRTSGRNSENDEERASQDRQDASERTLHIGGSQQDRRGQGRSQGNDGNDNRRGDTSGMGSDDQADSNGVQPGKSQNGNDSTVPARPGSALLNDAVQPLQQIQQPRPSQNGSDGNDNGRVQPVLNKKEDVIKNQNSWFATEHPVDIPKAGTAEALDTNIKALEVLASILEQNRQATQEEQDTLAKYTGFGNTKIDFVTDDSFFVNRMGETDRQRYKAVKEACDHIEKASGSLTPEDLKKFGLTSPVISKRIRRSLQDSMLTAFYTDQHIVRPMWNCLEQLGFKGGSILDPSSGNGRFFSNMPKNLAGKSSLHMVEIDTLTAMIASQMHPDARTINTGYEDYSKHNKADAIITNQPFSTIKVTDSEWVREGRMQQPQFKAAASQLTSYYPAKMLENLNSGGVMAVLTTSQFLDAKHHTSTRQLLASQAEFVGGVRLPMNAFANADVQSDILFFRKFNDGEKHEQHLQFVNTQEKDNPYYEGYGDGKTIDINEYFVQHPENIIGTEQKGFINRKYQPIYDSTLTPEEIGREVQQRVNTIVEQYKASHKQKEIRIESTAASENVENQSNNPTVIDEKLQKKVDAFNKIKDSMNALLKAYETDDPSQVELRKNFDQNYNLFVKDFGHLGDKKNVDNLSSQKEFPKVVAIENWRPKGPRSMEFVGKADIFRMNTIHPVAKDVTSDNPQDIINHSFHKHNKIVPELLEQKLGPDWILKTKGLIFLNPESKQYEPANYYLGGDVKTKLEVARAMAANDDAYSENVQALEAVQPKHIPINDISINFGANFVRPDIYAEYIKEMVFHNKGISDSNFRLSYNGSSIATSAYDIVLSEYLKKDETLCFGQGYCEKNASDIIEAALQNKHITINYPKKDKDDPTVQDVNSTLAANAKIDEIRNGFLAWLSRPQNHHHAEEIESVYNNLYNRTVPIKYDANFVEPVGCTLQLRPHQKSAVARILTGDDTLVDHPVGFGKTAVLISGIQEQHRLGLAQKSLLLCMKANVKQIAQEYQKMYPNANILFPKESDFKKENRNALLNKIKTNQYDCVILTHDQYGKLEHSKEIQEKLLTDKLNEYVSAIEANPEKNSPTLKQLTKKRQKIEQDLKQLEAQPHDPLAFEELGFDKLFIDESHQFKNLAFVTNHNKVAGLGSPEGSQKATKLLMGVRHIQQVNGGDKGVVFATGTPVTNSLVEVYNIMQFLKPSLLKEHNHQSFDAWAAQYAKKTEELEVQPSMAIKRVDRFREFVNIPELQNDYKSFADVPDPSAVEIKKPLENRVAITVPSGGDTHMQILRELKQVTETGNSTFLGVSLSQEKISAKSLIATSLGAKEAVSSRFLGIEPDEPESDKATAIARNVADIFKKTDEHKGVQLIFSEIVGPGKAEVYDDSEDGEKKMKADAIINWKFENFKEKYSKEDKEKCIADLAAAGINISKNFLKDHWSDDQDRNLDEDSRVSKIAGLATKGAEEKPYNLFSDIKNQLVNKYGIPEDQIVSIRDFSPTKRKEIFDKANNGEIRVIMGSTQTLGTGVNVQSHVVAMHHPDVPWTPASFEQRTGRGVRQGNEVAQFYGNKVDNIVYLKEKSADAKKYNLLAIKQGFISSFKDGSNTQRVVDTKEQSADSFFKDCLDETLGNPLFVERRKLTDTLSVLNSEKAAFESQSLTLSSRLAEQTSLVSYNRQNESKWKTEAEYLASSAPQKVDDKFPIDMNVNGVHYDSAKTAGDAIFRSTASNNKTVVEAYGYRFDIVPSVLNPLTDRDIKVIGRTGQLPENANALSLADLSKDLVGKFSFTTPANTDKDASKQSYVHIALAIRGMANDIEGMPAHFQKLKVQGQQQVAQLNSELQAREIFPKQDEITKIEARIREIDQQLDGESSLDLKNWNKLSSAWNSKNAAEMNALNTEQEILNASSKLFDKYIDLAHEESVSRNSLDMQKYPLNTFDNVGKNNKTVELAGPLVIDEERIRAILPPAFLKISTIEHQNRVVESLKESFISQAITDIVRPLKEKGENPHVALLDSPDTHARDVATDSARKQNEIFDSINIYSPVLLVSGSNLIDTATANRDLNFDFYQVKTSFHQFVANEFTNQFGKESFNLNPTELISKYEAQSALSSVVRDSFRDLIPESEMGKSVFPDNVSFTIIDSSQRVSNELLFENNSYIRDFKVTSKDLQDLVVGRELDSSEQVKSVDGEYLKKLDNLTNIYKEFRDKPQNADVNLDIQGIRDFTSSFEKMASAFEQNEYINNAMSGKEDNNRQAMPTNSAEMFNLLTSSLADLAKRNPDDPNIHLLASNSDGRIIPDPYHYANSAEVFDGYNLKVTIAKEQVKGSIDQQIWNYPSPAESRQYDEFVSELSRKGISYHSQLMDPKEKLERINNVSSSCNMQIADAKLYRDYSIYTRSSPAPMRLDISVKAVGETFDNGTTVLNKPEDFNKRMPDSLVGVYKIKGAEDTNHLQVYPIAAHPTHDANGNEIELVATASFNVKRASGDVVRVTPNLIEKQGDGIALDLHKSNNYVATNKITAADSENLLTHSQIDHTISFTSPSNVTHNVILYKDEGGQFGSPKRIKAYDPSSLELNQKMKQALGEDGEKQLRSGKCVEVKTGSETVNLVLNPQQNCVKAYDKPIVFAHNEETKSSNTKQISETPEVEQEQRGPKHKM